MAALGEEEAFAFCPSVLVVMRPATATHRWTLATTSVAGKPTTSSSSETYDLVGSMGCAVSQKAAGARDHPAASNVFGNY